MKLFDPHIHMTSRTTDDYAAMAAAGIAAVVEPAFWVGHSFGGRLVLELAARHPELVRRAVLLDPAIHVLPHVAATAADLERADHPNAGEASPSPASGSP